MVKYQNVAGDLDEPGRRPPVEEPPEIQRHLRRRLEGRWAARGAEFKNATGSRAAQSAGGRAARGEGAEWGGVGWRRRRGEE